MINTRINIEGEVNPRGVIEGNVNASTVKVYPTLENIEITPSKEEHIYKSKDYYGYDEVKVKGATSDIDENIKPEHIKEGVSILGVSGNANILNGEELIINKNGEYTPTEPMNAYTKVIADVPNDTSDATATAGDIATGKTAYISSGLVEGTGTISTPVAKGLVINSYDNDGFPTDVSLVGYTKIPNYYFFGTFSDSDNIFSRIGNNLHLPNNLVEIGDRAFYDCAYLRLTSLPKSLTTINRYAFGNCTNLTEMTLYGVIASIGNNAFYNCTNLAKIVLPNVTSIPTLGSNALTNTAIAKGNGYIYVPDSLITSFKSATNWSTYADQIKGVSEL